MVKTNAQMLPAWLAAALLALVAASAAFCGVALADDEGPDTAPVEPTELQLRVEESAAAYNDAQAQVEKLQARIDENSERIADIEAALPEQQAKADAAMVSIYKLSESADTLADVLLGVSDLDELISALEYLSSVASSNLDQIAKLQGMQKDLADTETRLLAEKAQAEKAVAKAEKALAEAQAAREEAAAAAQADIDAMRDALADEAAAQVYAQAQAQGASEEEAQAQADAARDAAAAAADANGVDWGMDRDAFVSEWASRIDQYLAGSPMAGQGSTFASAAWDYGVDPRWSPAIANTESTKGQYTFADHNAWGWGSASWGSWEEAINDHVKGLADGYGSTISQEGARKYCPPNADDWYSDTLSEMNRM